jgi:hypothetical protein
MKKSAKHAIHEAAHAIYAWYHGGKIRDLSIIGPVKERRTPYFCEVQAPAMLPLDELMSSDIVFRIGINLASFAAVKKIYGDLEYGEYADVNESIRFLTWNQKDEKITELYDSAIQSIDHYPQDYKKKAEYFYNENKILVESFIESPQIMEAIKRLADKLLNRGRLSGFETVRFIEKGWQGDFPVSAKPAKDHPTGVQPQSYEATVAAASRLCRMSLEILHDYRPENEMEETNIEKGIVALIQANLKLTELL